METVQNRPFNWQDDQGALARDEVTGLEGRITGFCQYVTGCHQILLQPKAKDGDYKEGKWFDVSRVTIYEGERMRFDPQTESWRDSHPGSDTPAPVR